MKSLKIELIKTFCHLQLKDLSAMHNLDELQKGYPAGERKAYIVILDYIKEVEEME